LFENHHSLKTIRKVWRYQRGNQKPCVDDE